MTNALRGALRANFSNTLRNFDTPYQSALWHKVFFENVVYSLIPLTIVIPNWFSYFSRLPFFLVVVLTHRTVIILSRKNSRIQIVTFFRFTDCSSTNICKMITRQVASQISYNFVSSSFSPSTDTPRARARRRRNEEEDTEWYLIPVAQAWRVRWDMLMVNTTTTWTRREGVWTGRGDDNGRIELPCRRAQRDSAMT